MDLRIGAKDGLHGQIVIPGDKSISHRSIIFASLAQGQSRISGFLESEDCQRTMDAFRNMGVNIVKLSSGEYLIDGVDLHGLKEPDRVIDCGNAGTTMRLLTGLLAAQKFYTVLSGDRSLCARPMGRVIKPLKVMGAQIWGRAENYAPLSINGCELQGISFNSPVASAQVKSAILLAGLYTDEDIVISEPGLSRDHTERMLKAAGVELLQEDNKIILPGGRKKQLLAQNFCIPGDISSAAFFIAAALITKDSEIFLPNIGINPTRCGFLEVIHMMTGHLELLNQRELGNEPVADILSKSAELKGIVIEGKIIPTLIDELPIIAVLASQAHGETIIRDAGELRVKETDRINAIVTELKKLGITIEELPTGMIINGPNKIQGGVKVKSYGDHRIAMSLAIAGLLADSEIIIEDCQCINTSFPEFMKLLKSTFQT